MFVLGRYKASATEMDTGQVGGGGMEVLNHIDFSRNSTGLDFIIKKSFFLIYRGWSISANFGR
jgi:hypothetical protein